jgi:hypothetical protein
LKAERMVAEREENSALKMEEMKVEMLAVRKEP